MSKQSRREQGIKTEEAQGPKTGSEPVEPLDYNQILWIQESFRPVPIEEIARGDKQHVSGCA
ncbi:MAG: hypothetical protein A2498_10000 [Lentisphaerae bacterium RIFOXYC12_FULL_60_16]|nr:MAG: hypothetical protein A2498_10000 [Lentisphaerae bacterium RIFOXYC12_FULL_60_16]OGV72516.1 MAG: hypothetical protein A2269_03805 [Lentisphaerae bacterium RIFOXYA12_FULL_60_10]OGV84767.1 MAG: hypothetical protein A2340_04400 [Lentisphaerae bacterium RIFOXYB12_FULL_60_10]